MSRDPLVITTPHPSMTYDNAHALDYWRFTFAGQFAAAMMAVSAPADVSTQNPALTLRGIEIIETAVRMADELITQLRCT